MLPHPEVLTPAQVDLWERLLVPVLKGRAAYMVGGTALSAVYYAHRTSYDFDFQVFPDDKEFIPAAWHVLVTRARDQGIEIELPRWGAFTRPHGWATGYFNGVKVELAIDPVGASDATFRDVDGIDVLDERCLARLKWACVAQRTKLHDVFDLSVMANNKVDIMAELTKASKEVGDDLRIPILSNLVYWQEEREKHLRGENSEWPSRPSWAVGEWSDASLLNFIETTIATLSRETLELGCRASEKLPPGLDCM